MKRLLSMMLTIVLLALLFVPLAAASDYGENEYVDPGYYYVYTENGKGLNVRDQPSAKGKVVGGYRYGDRIHVIAFTNENWALVTFRYDNGYGMGDYAAWVNRRFLTKNKPAARGKTKTEQEEKAEETAADPLEALNKEFSSARDVEDYAVTVRPTRVTGWVSMHWAPSVDAAVIATYKANDKLLVIMELENWLQVEDQNTGSVGFIQRSLIIE